MVRQGLLCDDLLEIQSLAPQIFHFIDRLVAAPDCGLGFLTRQMSISKLKVLSDAAKSV